MQGDKNCLLIYYSDMKSNFRKTMKTVFDFLEIEVDEAFIDNLEKKYYSIKSNYYQNENVKRGYAFYRKGLIAHVEYC